MSPAELWCSTHLLQNKERNKTNLYFGIMEVELAYLSFGFGVGYHNELVYCQAIMRENYFEVYAWNRRADIRLNDDMQWQIWRGTRLPFTIFDEVTNRIEM